MATFYFLLNIIQKLFSSHIHNVCVFRIIVAFKCLQRFFEEISIIKTTRNTKEKKILDFVLKRNNQTNVQ
jgi:hypothetical protein